jgi:hypothetical protein
MVSVEAPVRLGDDMMVDEADDSVDVPMKGRRPDLRDSGRFA